MLKVENSRNQIKSRVEASKMIQQEMATAAEPDDQSLIQNTHSGTGGPITAYCPLTSTWTEVKEIIKRR